MNDGISEVFNVIKSHCKKNGNPVFEEVVVVDLLKDLVPEHGPNQAAGIIIEMLDAQRISDSNNQTANENPTVENEAIEDVIDDDDNNESNDGSIVEVEVPKKIYPCIDLTDASPLSVIIEDSTNSEYVKHEKDEVSYLSDDYNADSYGSLQYDDSSDIDASISASCNPRPGEHPLIHLLSDLDESCKSYQSLPDNNSNVEISEILEENNNDPNNNLEGAIFEQPAEVHHLQNTNVSEQSDMDVSLPKNSNAVYSVIEEMIDSIPGCSKDTDVDVMNRMYKFNKSLPSTSSSVSPVPGCSKNVPDRILNSNDDENELDVLISKDETIQNDAMCIHEIIPWADILTIIRILKKHYNSSNRKQQTLWDLMSQQSSKSNNVPVKRKLSNDACSSSNKSLKKEDSKNETTVSPQGDNTTSNKSSDQLSADYEIPDVNELEPLPDNFFKTSHTSKKTDQSMLPSSNRSIVLDKMANQSPANLNIRNIHHPETSYNCLQPLYIKGMSTHQKEKNETVVSGILSSQKTSSNPLPLRVMDASTSHHSSSKEQFASVIKNPSSDSDKDNKSNMLSNNCNSFVLGRPKKEPLRDINHGLDPRLLQPTKELNKKPEELLKPAKFVVHPPPINLVTYAKKTIVDIPVHPAVLNVLKPDPDRQVFPVNQNPSVVQKIFSRDQVPNFSQFLDRDAEVKRLNNNRYQLEVQKREPSFLRPSVFEPPTIAKKRSAPATITATEAAKLEATVTKTVNSTNTLPTRNENSAAVPQPSTSTAPAAVVNNTEVPNSVYVKLRSMFPEVKKSYIKHICRKPPILISSSDANYTLSVLVDHLLREGQNNLEVEQMQLPKDEQPTVSLSVDEKYEYLLGLFPNADPTYLRDVVEKTCITDQSLEEFIQQKIESHDYPTKEQYLAKIKMTEQLKQYTSNFKVESFLELFSDPFKHFEDAKRECTHQTIALEFLKSFFNRNKVQTIAHLYKEQKYNLSLTAKRLSAIGQDMKTRRGNCEMITENIPLLQEITFIKNKQKILDHINAIRTREESLFKELKNKGMLMTCLCCYNDECMPTKSMECNSGHAFCHECIIRGTEATLADAEAHVRCFTECTSEFSLATLQKVLPPTMFSALLKKRQAAEVAAAEVEGLVSCPFCYFASIPPPEDKVFKCLNPECMKESCRLCKELNHVPMRCDEVTKTDEARRLIEEKMTEALLRTCYKCKKQFYKEEGCNKMKCPCGALMCYVCDKPVSGYGHFNAQGGVNADLCPLWSDDRRLNAEAVRRVAEETKNHILRNNPNLKIDTDALLPKIPEKSRGPHDDIPNANQLPEHVRRVITK